MKIHWHYWKERVPCNACKYGESLAQILESGPDFALYQAGVRKMHDASVERLARLITDGSGDGQDEGRISHAQSASGRGLVFACAGRDSTV